MLRSSRFECYKLTALHKRELLLCCRSEDLHECGHVLRRHTAWLLHLLNDRGDDDLLHLGAALDDERMQHLARRLRQAPILLGELLPVVQLDLHLLFERIVRARAPGVA